MRRSRRLDASDGFGERAHDRFAASAKAAALLFECGIAAEHIEQRASLEPSKVEEVIVHGALDLRERESTIADETHTFDLYLEEQVAAARRDILPFFFDTNAGECA